ncbi:hypothetical protein [Microbacterium sp. MAH-37]
MPAGAIVVGLVLGTVNDSLTRLAASIPMPVGMLFAGIVILVIVVVVKATDRA